MMQDLWMLVRGLLKSGRPLAKGWGKAPQATWQVERGTDRIAKA